MPSLPAARAAAPDPARPMVELAGVTKRYPGVVANADVSIAFHAGEVHVLLGENGAGKSTLVSMLTGLQQPDEGHLAVDGAPVSIASPRTALALGIGAVFQHSMLVPTLSLVDNAALGSPWWKRPDREAIAGRMRSVADGIGVDIRPEAITGSLSLGEQQQAEIVRALMRGSRMLILDEATAMLTPADAERLGALMRRLVAQNLAVVFITHKLNEAVAYGDRISVLRRGRKVGAIGPAELAELGPGRATEEIVRLMFGAGDDRSADSGERQARRNPPDVALPPVLQLMAVGVDDPAVPVTGIELKVRAGEIVGIAGIDGNGQKQLAEAVAGQRPLAGGRIFLGETPIEDLPVGERRRLGLCYVTDDRLGEGTVGAFPVAINLLLKEVGARPFWRAGIERPAAIAGHARAMVERFDIRTPSIDTPVGKLSGGNIQKLLLARELGDTTRVAIFAKPTYGLDLQNIAAARHRIREAADDGIAVLVFSTELEELLELSDRIAVMSQGRIVGTVDNGPGARRRIGELMSGVAS